MFDSEEGRQTTSDVDTEKAIRSADKIALKTASLSLLKEKVSLKKEYVGLTAAIVGVVALLLYKTPDDKPNREPPPSVGSAHATLSPSLVPTDQPSPPHSK